MSADAVAIATALWNAEARALDDKAWNAWLEHYAPDTIYWVPTWKDEAEIISDPQTQLSLIYIVSLAGLRERIDRIESGKAVTALPLPRTVHAYSNLEAQETAPSAIEGHAVFTTHLYDPRTARQHVNFGRMTYRLAETSGRWRITLKKLVLFNDRIATSLDINSL